MKNTRLIPLNDYVKACMCGSMGASIEFLCLHVDFVLAKSGDLFMRLQIRSEESEILQEQYYCLGNDIEQNAQIHSLNFDEFGFYSGKLFTKRVFNDTKDSELIEYDRIRGDYLREEFVESP